MNVGCFYATDGPKVQMNIAVSQHNSILRKNKGYMFRLNMISHRQAYDRYHPKTSTEAVWFLLSLMPKIVLTGFLNVSEFASSRS
jgi:hypothetical protein